MTNSLRDALRDAADGMPIASGATGRDLLRRGHRRGRLRRASGSTAGALVLAAVIGGSLGTGVLGGADGGPNATRSSDPATIETKVEAASFEVRSISQLEDTCSNIEEFANWTVVVGLRNEHSTTAVLLSPDGEQWATCFGSNDGDAAVLYGMKFVDNPGYRNLRVGAWWDGCETGADPEVCWWGAYGQVPADVARMTFESPDGQISEAVVRDGFYAWQSDVEDIDVFSQPLWLTLYDADGEQIDRINANRNPDTW